MKRMIIAMALCSVIACNSGSNASGKINEKNLEQAQEEAKQSGKYPNIVFEKTEHDFGKIKHNNPVETTFVFTNTGEVPLVITNVSSSCGCTVPEKPQKPIDPGEKGEIKVRYNGSGTEQVTKTITISSNAKEQNVMLTIKAFVETN